MAPTCAAPEFVTALSAGAFFGSGLLFFCPVVFSELFWAGTFFLDAFVWLVVLADFTVFFDDGFPGFLRADVMPERRDADFGAVFLTTFFRPPVLLFLVAAFFAAIALASETR